MNPHEALDRLMALGHENQEVNKTLAEATRTLAMKLCAQFSLDEFLDQNDGIVEYNVGRGFTFTMHSRGGPVDLLYGETALSHENRLPNRESCLALANAVREGFLDEIVAFFEQHVAQAKVATAALVTS